MSSVWLPVMEEQTFGDGLLVNPRFAYIDTRARSLAPEIFFFENRDGLWMSESFVRGVVRGSKYPKIQKPFVVRTAFPKESTKDTAIRKVLPAPHVVPLWQLAHLIEQQWGGLAGPLENTGRNNVFYTEVECGLVMASMCIGAESSENGV